MPITIPARHNTKLNTIMDRVNQDVELHQFWKCANINAVDRLGMSDHGEVHIRIVANIALKMLRLLLAAGVEPGVVKDHELTNDDAEVIVVLAMCLHDLGMAIHRTRHEDFSLFLAHTKLKELLPVVYEPAEATVVMAEVLHAIIAHHWDVHCLTVEAGVVKVADALDMTKGRSRIPFEAGQLNIHSVSAAAVEGVYIKAGQDKPISIEVKMRNSAGIFQLDELLKRKLENSGIAPYVEVIARIEGETEERLLEVYSL